MDVYKHPDRNVMQYIGIGVWRTRVVDEKRWSVKQGKTKNVDCPRNKVKKYYQRLRE